MPSFNIIKEINPSKTFRVASIMGKFDLQSEHIKESFNGEIDLAKEWQIGIIVGASGTGKSTIAKELFTKEYIRGFEYNSESFIDDFPKNLSIEEITRTLNSVGFSSPPSFIKPYSVLSNGEKMRVDLARALLNENDIIVFDEFTSVVDRNIAQIGSIAVAKSIRRTNKKFIAVACHYDIIEWLEPDWIFDTNEMQYKYTRGFLRRPQIEFKIYERKGMWNIFRKYHYLNNELNEHAKQFVGFINNVPVAFCASLHFPHPNVINIWKCTRLVVLPDYQGVGIGNRLLEFAAQFYKKKNKRYLITTSTSSLINSFQQNKNWKLIRYGRTRQQSEKSSIKDMKISLKRFTTTWEYICS